jgi:uncharacterized protein YpiB (UPF0302 family)
MQDHDVTFTSDSGITLTVHFDTAEEKDDYLAYLASDDEDDSTPSKD